MQALVSNIGIGKEKKIGMSFSYTVFSSKRKMNLKFVAEVLHLDVKYICKQFVNGFRSPCQIICLKICPLNSSLFTSEQSKMTSTSNFG